MWQAATGWDRLRQAARGSRARSFYQTSCDGSSSLPCDRILPETRKTNKINQTGVLHFGLTNQSEFNDAWFMYVSMSMYRYVYACVSVSVYIYIYTCIWIWKWTCICICVYTVYIYICTWMCMYMYMYMYMYVYVFVYVWLCMSVCLHVCTSARRYMYVIVHMLSLHIHSFISFRFVSFHFISYHSFILATLDILSHTYIYIYIIMYIYICTIMYIHTIALLQLMPRRAARWERRTSLPAIFFFFTFDWNDAVSMIGLIGFTRSLNTKFVTTVWMTQHWYETHLSSSKRRFSSVKRSQ